MELDLSMAPAAGKRQNAESGLDLSMAPDSPAGGASPLDDVNLWPLAQNTQGPLTRNTSPTLTNEDKLDAYISKYNSLNPDKPISKADIPDRSGFLGRVAELGAGLSQAVVNRFPEDLARIYEGGDVNQDESGFARRIIRDRQASTGERVLSRQVVQDEGLGKSLYEGPQSVATSAAVGIGGSVIGGMAGSVVPGAGNVSGAIVGGGTLSGVAFYRLAKNQFLHEMLDWTQKAKEAQGQTLSNEEWAGIAKGLDDDAMKFGLWEAGPEALSQMFTVGLLKYGGKTPLAKIPGLSKISGAIADRATSKITLALAKSGGVIAKGGLVLGAEVGEEEFTEGMTYFGQEAIRKKHGLRETDPSLTEFWNEQAGPVAVGSIVQLGGMKAADKSLAALGNRLTKKTTEGAPGASASDSAATDFGATVQATPPGMPVQEVRPNVEEQAAQDLPSGEDVMPYTRDDAHEVLRRHFGEEQAEPGIALLDAAADAWAEREGSTREAWYESKIAGILSPPGHETPQNSPEYSFRPDAQERDPQATGMDAQALREALRPLQDSAVNALPLEVVQSLEQLPEHLRRDADQGEGTPTAVFDPATKRVYLLADAIDTPAQAAALWMHEQGAHVGLRGLLGEQLDPFLDRVAEHVGREALAGIAAQHGIDLTTEDGLRHAAEEHLAGMAERIRAGEELTQVEQGVWDQLVAMLRDWLKGMGVVDPQALTDADLANAVRAAIRWTRYGEGGPTAVKTEEMMAAQSPPPAGPHLGAVETREDANGEKYVYENKLSEEESITTEYSSSNSGVYRKVKLSNGKQVHSVLNSVGEFVDASDINRRADEPDPEARAWTGDRETGDLLAQLGALSENMDLSGEQAGKLVEVIRRLATGKISREQAQVEADAITGATAAIMQDVAKSERGGGMLHQPELLDKALDKARDYGRRIVEAAKQWAEVVDKAASGKLHERTILQMGKTPDLLTQIGLPGLTMVMEKSTFDKVQAIKAKHGRVHHLTKEQVTALYKEMADPVAVLRYGKGKNGFTVVTTLREDGDPVIVGLDVDVKAGRVRVNEVTSAYGRERFPGWLVGKAAAGELVYLEKKKTAAILEDMSGPQLAGVLRARQRSGVKLYTESDVVKPIYDDGGKKLNQDSAPGESAYSARAAKQAGPRAGVQFLDDGRAIIHLFQTADPSSIIHETGHILRRMLPERDQAIVEDWCSVKDGLWTREAEEQFAKGFERYLYEGQAPTSRLRRVFQTLRDMLVRVYGSIRNIGGVKLTPEVRQVFDRLVSTQAERDAEAQAADSVHSFRVDEDAGMPGYAEELAASFSEIKDYEDLMAEAERLAYERFDLERRKEHRTLRAQWRAEAREIVDGYLPHRAMDAAVALGGLDHAMVSESYDAEFVRLLTMKRPGLVKRGTGLSPDAVALEHGYTDAHDMLEDILDVPAKGQIITDYMARREEAYQRQRALDSDFGGDYKAVQEATLEILSKLTKAQNRRMETMQARATVDELRLYDLAKLRAQARMERTRLQDQAKQAFNAGDHRRAQLLLNQMSQNDLLLREMERALAEREKIERSARTMLTRKIDEDWRQQARNWAGLFGLGGAKAERGGPELLDFLSIKGLHHFVDQDAIASLSRVPKGALSVDQYRDAHRVLRQIIHFGTWDTRIMGQRKAQEFDAVMGQVLGAILAKGPASPQVNIHPEPPSARRTGTMGEFLDGVSAYHAELLKPEHIFRQLDGQEDMGAVWSACFKPIVGSRGDFLALGEEVQAKLQAAFAPVRKELAAWRKKRLTIEEVPRNVVIRKGKEVEVQQGAPLQLTMEEIVMVALNSGNDGNREAIKAGFQWTEGDMAAILSRLGEREWAVVHQVWAAIEAIYPHLNRAHKRLTGVELKKVQPLPFVARTQSGQEIEVKGGYFPLIFDRELNWKADRQAAQAEMQDLFQSIYQKPNPKSGFTKERVGGRMAPRLDFGVIARHVLDTAHYATHAVAIRDVQKITTDQRFREAVEAAWSRPVYEQIAPWLQNVARPAKEESSRMERFFARTRRNVQIVAMGWKPFTAFLQLTSLTSTAYKVGWAQTVRSVSALITHPHEAMQFVSERSIALRNRRNSFDRDVVDMLGQFDPSKSGMLDTVHRTAFALIGVVDSAVAYATWQAAYTQAMEQNGWSEEKACEYADMTVRLSQGDGAAMSLARVQHGNELRKFVTMFYSWFSTNYNNIAEANRRAFGEGASMPKTIELAKAYWWLLIAPAILEQLLRNGPPDDDEKKRGLGLSIFSYYMSSFPVLRSLSSALAEGRSFELSPVLSAIESPVDLANAFKAKKDRGRKVAKATLLGAGYLWGLPSRQAVTVMDAALDMAEGKTKNPLRFIVPAPKKKKNAATRRVTYGGN